MTTNLPTWRYCDVVTHDFHPLDPQYRLWRGPPITKGNPIIILVHGAVVPIYIPNRLNTFHDPTNINKDKYCFYDLDVLLYSESDPHYNVFTFEYADVPIRDLAGILLGHVNYQYLELYSNRLIEAIEFAKKFSEQPDGTVGPVIVIAHSMGGLIARCAAKKAAGTISEIITLDTGHCGFELANFINQILTRIGVTLPPSMNYQEEVKEGSDFINNLNEGFKPDNPKLVSLGACDQVDISSLLPILPPLKITVTGLHSASMGQVDDSNRHTPSKYNIPFYPLHYNHANIMQIRDFEHCAYKVIKKSLGKDVVLCE